MDQVPISDGGKTKERSELANLFFGKQGLHAGWSVLIFVSGVASLVFLTSLLFLVVITQLDFDLPFRGLSPQLVLAQDGVGLAIVALVTAGLARIENRLLLSYGLKDGRAVRRCLWGVFSGFVALSLLIGGLFLLGLVHVSKGAVFSLELIRDGLLWALAFVFVGLFEETLSRGYLQATLTRPLGPVWASLLTSLGFLGLHLGNPGETWLGMVNIFLVGLVLCFSLVRTGSLWWAIGFHAAWDWGQTFFYGTANSGFPSERSLLVVHPMGVDWLSGGSVGPEGSLLMVLVCLGLLLGLRAWPRGAGSS